MAQKYANGGEVDLSKPFIGYPNLPQPRQPRQPRASIDTIKATPQSPLFGSVARRLRSLQEMASKYEVNPRIPLLGGTAKEFNDLQKKVIDALPPEGFAAGGLVSDNEYNSDTVDDIVSQFRINQLVEEMYG